LMLLLISSLFSLEWETYESALVQQKGTNKIIMIDAVRTGCHFCEDMDKKVFDIKEMSEWIKQRFIPVKINLAEENLPLGLHVSVTPTFFFINKDSKVIKRIRGSWNIEDFKDLTGGIK